MNENQPRSISEQEFRDLQERYRVTSEQLNQMKGTLDAVMVQRNQPQRQEPAALPKTRLTPEAQEDVVKLAAHLFQQGMSQQQETFRGAYNNLWERTDLAEFRAVRPGVYENYKDKIEALRDQKKRDGQFITRDEAYKYVHFDETGKKPKETLATPEPPKPVFDPYLQQWVIPQDTKAPVTQTPQVPAVTPPVKTENTPAPNPTVTLDGVKDDFNLPPEGQMKSTMATPPASTGAINLDISSEEAVLKNFEAKYGDVPL